MLLEQALFPRTRRRGILLQRRTRLAQTVADTIFDRPELGLVLFKICFTRMISTLKCKWPQEYLFPSEYVQSAIKSTDCHCTVNYTKPSCCWICRWITKFGDIHQPMPSNRKLVLHFAVHLPFQLVPGGGGGTDLERGYGYVPRSWPPSFRPVGAP